MPPFDSMTSMLETENYVALETHKDKVRVLFEEGKALGRMSNIPYKDFIKKYGNS